MNWNAGRLTGGKIGDDVCAADFLNTVKVTCQRTGLSHPVIYAAIKSGRLRAVKLGRSTRIRESDFQAWLDGLPTFGAKSGGGK